MTKTSHSSFLIIYKIRFYYQYILVMSIKRGLVIISCLLHIWPQDVRCFTNSLYIWTFHGYSHFVPSFICYCSREQQYFSLVLHLYFEVQSIILFVIPWISNNVPHKINLSLVSLVCVCMTINWMCYSATLPLNGD